MNRIYILLAICLILAACGQTTTTSTGEEVDMSDFSAETEEPTEEDLIYGDNLQYDHEGHEEELDSVVELEPFVPQGYQILGQRSGDLNNDGIDDVILILSLINEADLSSESEELIERPLLLLVRQEDMSLKEIARNNNVVLCYACGGVFGDPYSGIAIKGNYFSIEHYGGSNWRWTNIITFKYSTEDNWWFLHKIGEESYNTGDPDNVETKIKTKANFGKIRFEDYDGF